LTILDGDTITAHGLVEDLEIIRRYLMTETPGTTMKHNDYLVLTMDAQDLCNPLIIDIGRMDDLNLHVMVPGA
jgi:hypothetical protein